MKSKKKKKEIRPNNQKTCIAVSNACLPLFLPFPKQPKAWLKATLVYLFTPKLRSRMEHELGDCVRAYTVVGDLEMGKA